MEFPLWSSGEDSMLPIQGAKVQFPGEGTRAHMPQLRPSVAK